MSEARPFFHRVESLRGIGALIVAGWHLAGWGVNGFELLPHHHWTHVDRLQDAAGRLLIALLPGHSALMVFFVISGLVLRVSLQYGPQGAGPATVRFVIARIFRIYPVVVFSMVLAVLTYGWQIPATELRPSLPLDVPTFIANLLAIDVSLNSVLWAIQVEILMVPIILLLYFVERRYGPWALLGIAVVASALSFSGGWALWRPLSHNLFAFVLGMLVPTLGCKFVQRLSPSWSQWLLIAVVISLYLTGPAFGFFSRFAALFEGYLAALLISLVAYRLDLKGLRWLDRKPVRLLGLSSGSYYVLHMLLMAWIVPVVAMAVPMALSVQVPVLVGPLIMAVVLAAVSVPALLSYYAIEERGIALGRRVNAELAGRTPVAVPGG